MAIFYKPNFFIKRFIPLLFFFLGVYGISYGQYTPAQSIDTTDILWHTPEGYDSNSSEKYPLLVYLHGSYNIVKRTGGAIEGLIKLHLNDNMPEGYDQFFIVMPYLERDTTVDKYNDQLWPVKLIDEVIDSALVRYAGNVDKDRIYMTGISLGGKGTWDYAKAHPERLAAIVPIAANVKLDDICNLTEVPVWALHGIDDMVVLPYGESTGENQEGRYGSIDAISALNACSPTYPARLTLVDGLVHNGFDAYYDLTMGYNLYEWMLQFSKENTGNHAPLVNAGPDLKLVKPSFPITILGKASDAEGNISTITWTQLSGPTITLANANKKNLELSNIQAGSYGFKLTVTDNSGAISTDIMSMEIVDAAPPDNSVTGITIHNLVADRSAEATNGLTISTDIASMDEEKDAFYFTVATNGAVSNVRYSINQNRNQATASQWQRDGFTSASSVPKDKTAYSTHWSPQNPGTYIISATPFRNNTPGVSVQYKITVTHDPLPVEFINVSVQVIYNDIKIQWTTSTETNNDFFTIERSGDMETFEPIGRVKGAGNSESVLNYSYTDHFPLSGVSYYRVKQTDFDGRLDYSKIVSVDKGLALSPEVIVFPNPLKQGNITVKISGNISKSDVGIQLVDALGRIYLSVQTDAASVAEGFEIAPTHQLDKGLYVLILHQDEHVVQKKVVIN